MWCVIQPKPNLSVLLLTLPVLSNLLQISWSHSYLNEFGDYYTKLRHSPPAIAFDTETLLQLRTSDLKLTASQIRKHTAQNCTK